MSGQFGGYLTAASTKLAGSPDAIAELIAAIAAATPTLPKMDAREYAERITVKVTLVKLSISKPRAPESHVNSCHKCSHRPPQLL